MGRIQSSIGLITGVPIADTVDQLIAISARPRDLLISRGKEVASQQVALTEITALVIGVQFSGRALGNAATFTQRTATSSNASAVSVSVTGSPSLGTYQFTPVQKAQSHQLLSTGFAASDQPIGEGEFKFRYGGFIDQGASLDALNNGAGIQRGKIRITDRSGDSAVVDLRFVKTVDDVLKAINQQSDINVTAVAEGDKIRLIDNTSQTTSNLIVKQIGTDTTAADLGLGNINVAAAEALGQDILSLHENSALGKLNGGNGVRFGASTDLKITLRDASTLNIDLTSSSNPTKLGEVIDLINAASPAKLSAKISASGDTIELTDLTGGGGDLTIEDGAGKHAATDLGIATTVSGDTITSRRLQAGLKTSLLASLGGGQGVGLLGNLVITDRAGNSDTIDLSSAETLDEVIVAINAASNANITASVNASRNGIKLTDTSGGIGNLTIANDVDGKETADKLRIAVDDTVNSFDSGSLDLQVISANTLISTLNQGKGVQQGSFTVQNTNGVKGAINLKTLDAVTVGDVIDAINALGIGVVAEINPEGDGIRLRDTASGALDIVVTDSGTGKAAANLGIAGTSSGVDVNGVQTEVISGSSSFKVSISATDTVTDVIAKINDLGSGVTASLFNDGGSGSPFHITLTSQTAGSAGELLINTSGAGFSFNQLAQAQDALLLIGSADAPGAGFLASSSSNQFKSVLNGATLTINDATASPITVEVKSTDAQLVSSVDLFVTAYNKLKDKLDSVSFFNEADDTTGILFGSNETLRIEGELSRFISGRHFGLGSVKSLSELGLNFDAGGKLTLDKAKLQSKFAADPDAVRDFLSGDTGVAKKLDQLSETLAGAGGSLLVNRLDAIQRKITDYEGRIEAFNARLDAQRDRMLLEFYRLESVIGNLQNSLTAVEALQPLPSLVSTR